MDAWSRLDSCVSYSMCDPASCMSFTRICENGCLGCADEECGEFDMMCTYATDLP